MLSEVSNNKKKQANFGFNVCSLHFLLLGRSTVSGQDEAFSEVDLVYLTELSVVQKLDFSSTKWGKNTQELLLSLCVYYIWICEW